LTQKQLTNRLVKLAPRMGKTWAAEILQALSEQTVVASAVALAAGADSTNNFVQRLPPTHTPTHSARRKPAPHRKGSNLQAGAATAVDPKSPPSSQAASPTNVDGEGRSWMSMPSPASSDPQLFPQLGGPAKITVPWSSFVIRVCVTRFVAT
jgi:hypothetical protein